MAAKITLLVVASSVFVAFATNDSIIKEIPDITKDPQTSKYVADVFEDALMEEEPGLKDEEKREDEVRHESRSQAHLRSSTFPKEKPLIPAPISLKPDELGETSQFEKDVTDLIAGLSHGGFSATPFGNSVTKIVELIEKEMMPQVESAHEANQKELNQLDTTIKACGTSKNAELLIAENKKTSYTTTSTSHKSCRGEEASLYTENVDCHKEWKDAKETKELKCKQFAYISNNFGEYVKNQDIMKKAASEEIETYITRVSNTVCGKPGGEGGFLNDFTMHKKACEEATNQYNTLTTKCKDLDKSWHEKRTSCDLLQDTMDTSACSWNVAIKDACETYTECFNANKGTYDTTKATVIEEEKDRKAEWRGLKRMKCIIDAFSDGQVLHSEIDACKAATVNTDHLTIVYPDIDDFITCQYTQLFPTTAEYKAAEFVPLPTLAKGKLDANECSALKEISTTPLAGSPADCKCERVTMDGAWSPGALVKCSNCLDVSRSEDKNSCPGGTKLFAPQTRQDWETFIKSAKPFLRDPNLIIDVTRKESGCGGCHDHSMNSGVAEQESWATQDGSPWWLRATAYTPAEDFSDYVANCYLDVASAADADSVTFNGKQCSYHSKSYYCQPRSVDLTPGTGSPAGCTCKNVELMGEYSASNILVKCEKCLDVYKSTDANSCPAGMKIFSPRTRADWKTFLSSATPLRSPNWIVDVTRPQNGCGGCSEYAMKSTVPAQATWHTTDASPWWLRDATYTQPNGDYTANCYLDLWHNPANENSVTFDDSDCHYHSRSYYCQPVSTTTTTTTTAEVTFDEAKEALQAAIGKAATSKQLLTLEAGRLEFLANYLKQRATVIKEGTDLSGNAAVSDMMKGASAWADEVQAEVTKCRSLASQLTTRLEEGEQQLKNEVNEYTKGKMKEEKEGLDKLIPKAKEAFDVMMTHQDLISPRVSASGLAEYTKTLSYFDAASTDLPSTCVGPSVVKPIVGKSYAECASACDRQLGNCVGFTFFPSKMCFLHRKIFGVTSYTGCTDPVPDPSAATQEQLRLSCVVKSARFEELYPADTRTQKIAWTKADKYCPVYDDEGVKFKSPVTLTADAFKEGTFIITAPGVYELDQDVSFNPVTPLSSGVSSNDVAFPDPTSEKYPQLGGYFLGFFAVISVASDNVTIDCKNHKIGMSLEFHRRQRYFSIIELGSKPFISGAGPPQFASGLLSNTALVSPSNVKIQNCKLGRSSHHGIHGNNNKGVHIKNTQIADFEVGGIHFNGASNVHVEDTVIGPSLKLTFQAYLSQANFIDHLMNSLMPMNPEINVHRKDAKVTLRGSERSVHDVFMDLHNALHEFYVNEQGPFKTIFRATGKDDVKGLPDGSAVYGIVIHKTGPAVNDFGACSLTDAQAGGSMITDVKFNNVEVNDLDVEVRQITRIILEGNQVMGPAGDVFDADRVMSADDHYVGNILSDAQLATGAFKAYLKDKIEAADLTYFFGACHIPTDVLTWAASGSTAWTGGTYSCMGDSMSHFNKGAVGLFLNHIESSDIKNVKVKNIANSGKVDADPAKCVQGDYKGGDSRGIAIVNSPGVTLDDTVTVESLTAGVGGNTVDKDTIST